MFFLDHKKGKFYGNSWMDDVNSCSKVFVVVSSLFVSVCCCLMAFYSPVFPMELAKVISFAVEFLEETQPGGPSHRKTPKKNGAKKLSPQNLFQASSGKYKNLNKLVSMECWNPPWAWKPRCLARSLRPPPIEVRVRDYPKKNTQNIPRGNHQETNFKYCESPTK